MSFTSLEENAVIEPPQLVFSYFAESQAMMDNEPVVYPSD